MFVVSVETGEKRQLTHPGAAHLADTDPAVSPDGKWLVFRRDVAPFSGQLQLVALGSDLSATGEPRPITSNALAAYSPQWMPDSAEILFSAKGALWRLGIAEGSVPERLPFVGEDGLMPVVSRPQPGRRARLVYVRSFADQNIWRDRHGGRRRAGDRAACRRHRVHATRGDAGAFSRWPARGVHLRSIGRV